MRGSLLACLLVGCGFSHGELPDDGGPAIDAPRTDASPESVISTSLCFGTATTICFAAPLTAPLILTTQAIDTAGSACMPYTSPQSADVCILAGASISLASGTTIIASGPRPLVLVSASTITVASGAMLDVASRRGQPSGAAADATSCSAPSANGAGVPQQGGGAGGGAGGSFGGAGGNGGGSSASVGGTAGATVTPTALRGGCAGGNGGAAGVGGAGGRGGGAIALIASNALRIDGAIDASGGAGGGSTHNTTAAGGGGGGGAGGMIRLEAPKISVTGQVFANGGGGGEGGSTSNNGIAGGESTASSTPGLGGAGGAGTGGDGGNGSSGIVKVGGVGWSGTNVSGSGGGGGGGAGVIQIVGASVANSPGIAPPPT